MAIANEMVYRIVTLDYLAEALTTGCFPQCSFALGTGVTLRDVMIAYVKEQTRHGDEVVSTPTDAIIHK